MKRKAVVNRIFNIFTAVIVLLAVLLTVTVFVCKANHRVFFLFHRSTVWVLTDSMEDTIQQKSFILIRQATADEVRIGDVITFYSSDPALGGALNTHRVVDIREDTGNLITKGDHPAATVDTFEVLPENVVGIYERSLPFLSVFGRIFQTPFGLCLMLSLILLLCIAYYLPSLLKRSGKPEVSPSPEEQKQAEMERLIAEEVERLKKEGCSSPTAAKKDPTEKF